VWLSNTVVTAVLAEAAGSVGFPADSMLFGLSGLDANANPHSVIGVA